MNTTKDRRTEFEDGVDAVFLPGKIHGCQDQLYIIYFNSSANNEEGCWEIEVIDYERILKLFAEVEGNAEDFFDILPDWFHGEWYYCNYGKESFDEYADAYHTADFIIGRDGGIHEEMMFLVNWAKERENFYKKA